MVKEKLVRISNEHHRTMRKLRAACKREKVAVVPSIPFLVERALDIALPRLMQQYWPEDD